MVIFHSYVAVYQRVLVVGWNPWFVDDHERANIPKRAGMSYPRRSFFFRPWPDEAPSLESRSCFFFPLWWIYGWWMSMVDISMFFLGFAGFQTVREMAHPAFWRLHLSISIYQHSPLWASLSYPAWETYKKRLKMAIGLTHEQWWFSSMWQFTRDF